TRSLGTSQWIAAVDQRVVGAGRYRKLDPDISEASELGRVSGGRWIDCAWGQTVRAVEAEQRIAVVDCLDERRSCRPSLILVVASAASPAIGTKIGEERI